MMPSMPAGDLFVGVDLGGSKILAGVFDESLRLVDTARRSTKAERGPKAVVERVVRAIRDAVDEGDSQMHQIRAVVVGVPGRVEESNGRVVAAPNLGMREFPLAERLRDALGIPVSVENDHKLATLGIYSVELKARPRRLLALFVGSRVGGGWVVDGQLCAGFGGGDSDLGHVVLDPEGPRCRCGGRGCFESLASRQAVMDRIRESIQAGRASTLSDSLRDVGRMRGKELRQAYRNGDPLVREVVGRAAHWLDFALRRLVRTLGPEVVMLGGGMAELLRDSIPVERGNGEQVPRVEDVPVRMSSLGEDACIAGAALLASHLRS